jgi:hypothetical protein
VMRRPGPIHSFLAEDHTRLDALLRRATADPDVMDAASFEEFRSGILRHIAMEEKILLPAAREANGGEPLSAARRLRVEHGAIAMLLVPTPTREIVAEIRSVLSGHNEIEEGPGGLYEQCDQLLAGDAESMIARLRNCPRVKVAPHVDGPGVCRRAEDALRISSRQRVADGSGRSPG